MSQAANLFKTPFSPLSLIESGGNSAGYGDHHQDGGCQAEPVPPHKFGDPVGESIIPRQNRPTLQVTAKVGRDLGHFGFASNTIVYGSKKADVITLREGDEKAFGLGGNDTLVGGDGDDVLNGGTGDDTLTGGAGADTFIYSGGSDVIADFNAAEGDTMVGDWPT